MTEIKRESKNAKIGEAMKATRVKRKAQCCRVFEVKITAGKLSSEKKEHINRLFLEGKWLWNHTVSQDDVFSANRDAKSVIVKTPDGLEERPLTALGSQMKQDIVDSLKSTVKGLATKKKKGEKVGRIGFRKYCNSIPLRQYGVTYRIDFEKDTVSIQGLRKPIKVRGLSQIPEGADIANAKIVRRPSGLYFHITTYTEKEERINTEKVGACDFGIARNFTFDDGREFDISVPESRKLKRDQRKMNRLYVKNGDTKNHGKRKRQIRRDYEKIENIKTDKANKLVHLIHEEYDIFAIQDEMISCWHKGLFGRQVQHSAMGRVKALLKDSPHTIVVDRAFPSTQRCPICGLDTKHPLVKRDYDCPFCGYHHDSRDQKSAIMILKEALKQNVCAERTAKGPVQATASTGVYLNTSGSGKPSPIGMDMILPDMQEAQVFRLG
jgi:transposase